MCQNTTMRVNGAWIKRCCVLCSKTYNTLHSCHNFPAGSRQAARGARICETSLLKLVHVNKRDPSCVALDKLVKISDTSENIWYMWLYHCDNIWYIWYSLIDVIISMQCLITHRTHMGVPPWNICKGYCGINNSSSVLSRSYLSYLCIYIGSHCDNIMWVNSTPELLSWKLLLAQY